MNRFDINGMLKAIKDHFPGFSDASVRAPLETYWRDKLMIVWTVDDVFSALNGAGKAISLEAARLVLVEAERNHEADRGITWEVLRDHVSGLQLPTLRLSDEQLDSGCTYYIGLDQRVHIWEGDKNADT